MIWGFRVVAYSGRGLDFGDLYFNLRAFSRKGMGSFRSRQGSP